MNTPSKPSKPITRLTPARPDLREESASAYLPRIPWHFVLLATLSLATVIGGFYWKEQRKAADLRASILRVHETELAEARNAYLQVRNRLEGLIMGAAAAPDTLADSVDKRLRLTGLRKGNGLYLRLPLTEAHSKESIAQAAKSMVPDMIANCLGLAPSSARGLYEKGEFLLPAFVADIKHESNVLKLRVKDEVLSRHIRADLPSVLGTLHADWFMLVLQEGDDRREAPVRVFLWDLNEGEMLLRARVKSQGVLLISRILSLGLNPNAAQPGGERTNGAANDCSIASALKALTSKPAAADGGGAASAHKPGQP
jgi:hypothetical protein